MTPSSITVILNPAAGRGRVGRMAPQLEAALRKVAGEKPLQLLRTQAPGDGVLLAQEAPAGSRVVAVGGDGTVHELIRGIAHSDRSLGVVPIGSGNDFARMAGLHGLSLEQSLEVALGDKTQAFDLGEVNGEAFGASVGIGFDAQVAHKALSAPPFLRGMPRYLYSLFAVLRDLKLPELVLEAEGKVLFQGRALLSALMNARTYGGGIPITPKASPHDGLLSVLVAGEFSKIGVLGILPRLLAGKHLGHPRVYEFSGRSFTVRYDRATPAHADGELLQTQSTYEVRIHPGALQVAVP